jgi:hypothetical protein
MKRAVTYDPVYSCCVSRKKIVFFSLVLFFFASALPGVRPEHVILLQFLGKSGLSVQCSLLKLLLLGSRFRIRAELADQR